MKFKIPSPYHYDKISAFLQQYLSVDQDLKKIEQVFNTVKALYQLHEAELNVQSDLLHLKDVKKTNYITEGLNEFLVSLNQLVEYTNKNNITEKLHPCLEQVRKQQLTGDLPILCEKIPKTCRLFLPIASLNVQTAI